MPTDLSLDLVEANRSQRISETDLFTPDRYRQMQSHFPKHAKKILDMGCNIGRGGKVLKAINPAYELTGLDCVPERLATLDKSVYQQALCGFSSNLPVSNNHFDVIVGGEFIEHVPPSQIDPTLAEFFRVLQLKGRLLLTTPNPNYLKNKLKNLSVLLEESHLSQHFPDALTHRMRLIGFSQISVFGSGRVSSYIGQRFPWLSVYGSYLIQGDKW
jgi:ubiquinone/menaquinone biosynthesis C-methylase UbiE